MDDLACTDCEWTGNSWEKVYGKECPECGEDTEYIKDEYYPYQKPFNYNKP